MLKRLLFYAIHLLMLSMFEMDDAKFQKKKKLMKKKTI